MLGDFRSCQILWALRLLGGVGEAPIEVGGGHGLGIFEAPLRAAAVERRPGGLDEGPVAERPSLEREPEAEAAPSSRSSRRTSSPNPSRRRFRSPRPTNRRRDHLRAVAARRREALRSGSTEVESPESVRPGVEPKTSRPLSVDSRRARTPRRRSRCSREDVEAALHANETACRASRLGEPGTGEDIGEDMKIDMRPGALAWNPQMPPSAETSTKSRSPCRSPDRSGAQARRAPDLDRTVRVSRRGARSGPRAPPTAEPQPVEVPRRPQPPQSARRCPRCAPSAFEPPADLDGVIAAFNARHVILFRALRAEIGAGAANFVRSCRAALDERFAGLFATAELRADGSWDPEGLKRSVDRAPCRGRRPTGFRRLLDGELKRLRAHWARRGPRRSRTNSPRSRRPRGLRYTARAAGVRVVVVRVVGVVDRGAGEHAARSSTLRGDELAVLVVASLRADRKIGLAARRDRLGPQEIQLGLEAAQLARHLPVPKPHQRAVDDADDARPRRPRRAPTGRRPTRAGRRGRSSARA